MIPLCNGKLFLYSVLKLCKPFYEVNVYSSSTLNEFDIKFFESFHSFHAKYAPQSGSKLKFQNIKFNRSSKIFWLRNSLGQKIIFLVLT